MSIACQVFFCVCCCCLSFLLLCIAEVCGEYSAASFVKVNYCSDAHNKECFHNVMNRKRWFLKEKESEKKEKEPKKKEAAHSKEEHETFNRGGSHNSAADHVEPTQDLSGSRSTMPGAAVSAGGSGRGGGEHEEETNGTSRDVSSPPEPEHTNEKTITNGKDTLLQTKEIKGTTLTSPIPKIENSVSQPESVTNSKEETENDNQKKDSEERAKEVNDQNSESQTGQFNNENNEQPLFETPQKPTEVPTIFSSATVTNTVGDSAAAEITASMKKPLNLIFVFLLFSILPGCVLVL